jgi:hypothetical protein
LTFLYYFDRYTTDTILTKTAMPLLAIAGGVLPHVLLRLRFVFTICSLVAGAGGLVVLYFIVVTVLSGGSFATRAIGFIMAGFAIGSTGAGVLTVVSLQRTLALRLRPL